MSTTRNATIADVVRSVLSSDGSGRITQRQASDVVNMALRTIIGLNCLGGSTLDIDLGNGHTLHCSLKRAIGPSDV